MWLIQANKGTLDHYLLNITTTILLLQQTKRIPSRCDAHDKTAPIQTYFNKKNVSSFFGMPLKVAAYQWIVQTRAVVIQI